jgi:hypothetical protein
MKSKRQPEGKKRERERKKDLADISIELLRYTVGEITRRIMSSGILRRVALVRTEASEELSAYFIRVTRIGKLGTMLAVTNIVPSSPILVTLMNEALSSSETSVLTRATRRNIPEDTILHSHRRENLNSYKNNKTFVIASRTIGRSATLPKL